MSRPEKGPYGGACTAHAPPEATTSPHPASRCVPPPVRVRPRSPCPFPALPVPRSVPSLLPPFPLPPPPRHSRRSGLQRAPATPKDPFPSPTHAYAPPQSFPHFLDLPPFPLPSPPFSSPALPPPFIPPPPLPSPLLLALTSISAFSTSRVTAPLQLGSSAVAIRQPNRGSPKVEEQ